MPTYTVKYSNINLSQKQKNSIANDITNTHSKYTGANTFFAQVIFQKNEKNAHFMGGKLVKTKEIFLNGQIRAGRTSKVKKQLILGLRKILIKNTKLQSDFVWVYLEDLLPDQMIEYGEVLPKSGQEKKWFNSLSPSLRKRLKKMEKKMKIEGKSYKTIWFENNLVKIIDQTKLPHQFIIKDLKTVKDAINAIKTMEVRGAPLIGATAAYGLVLSIIEKMIYLF